MIVKGYLPRCGKYLRSLFFLDIKDLDFQGGLGSAWCLRDTFVTPQRGKIESDRGRGG